ncbi:hypothetical protein [Starkeya nomas]|uniref:hypothetical protein n=1 Tax=Starkeya nomas TaxID=2666134 RepID=UPI001359D274|nr:hypothetical protein [Starkeya nomas]
MAISVGLIASVAPATATEPSILPRIILKSKAAVTAVLGAPDRCETSTYGDKCTYRNGQVEIVYINGKADWITYNNPPGVGFYPAALTRLGVNCPVDISKIGFAGDTFAWRGTCPGLHSAAVFAGEGDAPTEPHNRRVSYIYIKAKTP